MNQHTPTPWTVNSCGYIGTAPKSENDTSWTLIACPPELHGETPYIRLPSAEERAANAEFIIRAVNSHDALLAACQKVHDNLFVLRLEYQHLSPGLRSGIQHQLDMLRSAIAQATGNKIPTPAVSECSPNIPCGGDTPVIPGTRYAADFPG